MLKGAGDNARGHQPADVRHVRQQPRAWQVGGHMRDRIVCAKVGLEVGIVCVYTSGQQPRAWGVRVHARNVLM